MRRSTNGRDTCGDGVDRMVGVLDEEHHATWHGTGERPRLRERRTRKRWKLNSGNGRRRLWHRNTGDSFLS